MKFYTLLLITAVSLFVISSAGQSVFGYGGPPENNSANNYTVDISTNQESYGLGESVVFTGTVNKYDEDRSLRISVFDTTKNLIITKKTPVNSDGTFSYVVELNEKFSDGKYIVKAQYGTSKSTVITSSFMITANIESSMTSTNISEIPVWVKNNAGWWADGSIDDSSFVLGIQFLVQEGFMKIPVTEQGSGTGSNEIPVWVKNNAGWWADGSIDDSSFVLGIQFLVQEGFMKIIN
jgi:hypothetical protein